MKQRSAKMPTANLACTTEEGTYFPWSTTQEGSIGFTDVTRSTNTTPISATPSDKRTGGHHTATEQLS